MTHQAQAPSVYSARPPTNGTSDGKVETAGIIRNYIEHGAKPVGATAGTRMVDAARRTQARLTSNSQAM